MSAIRQLSLLAGIQCKLAARAVQDKAVIVVAHELANSSDRACALDSRMLASRQMLRCHKRCSGWPGKKMTIVNDKGILSRRHRVHGVGCREVQAA